MCKDLRQKKKILSRKLISFFKLNYVWECSLFRKTGQLDSVFSVIGTCTRTITNTQTRKQVYQHISLYSTDVRIAFPFIYRFFRSYLNFFEWGLKFRNFRMTNISNLKIREHSNVERPKLRLIVIVKIEKIKLRNSFISKGKYENRQNCE